ncbi:MAG: PAS domain-containing hybrid sensor histidine kinase/response regulator [Telluria sp.]
MVGFITQAIPVLAATTAFLLLLLQTRRLRLARDEAAASRAALLEMEVAYDDAPLGLTVLDRELRYVRINKMLASLNGVSAEQHLGKTIDEVVPDVAAAAGSMFADVLRTGVPVIGIEFEAQTAAHPRVPRAYRESIYPVRDREGKVIAITVAVEDITERKQLLDALHASELRERLHATELESVMDATPAAVFIARDRACQNVTANAEAARLLRLASGQSPSLSVPGRHKYEGYAGGVALRPEQLPLQVAAASGREVRGTELEVRFDNGEVLHVLMNAVPLRGQDGEVIGSAAAFVDITVQKRAVQELERQSRHKDEFLAVLAHELRNPLAAIQAGLELLKIHAAGSTQLLGRTRDIMQRQMAHMVRLIDDLLDVARISSGKLELQAETACVRDIVDAAIELCRGEIEHRRHRLRVVLPPGPLYVHADRVRLTEVVSNLLHNAVKYTADGGDIGITVERDAGEVVFRVTDNGMGIAPESLPQVFTMFAQAEDARARRKGGLGVGLALARRIVELHGGEITAESDGPGKGSTFTVRLPAAECPAGGPAEHGGAATAPAKPLRILVLDDNADAASTLGAMLEASGHTVRLAFTGAGALEALARFDADIAILDIGLPDISGHEVARRIRAGAGERQPFLAALSGWGSEADRQQSEEAGIDLHLTKPVTMAAMAQMILAREGQDRAVQPS